MTPCKRTTAVAFGLVAVVVAAGCGSDTSSTGTAATAPVTGVESSGSPEDSIGSSTTADDRVEITQETPPGGECPATGEEWEVAKLYIEHNATDSDTGVHGLFGGEAWSVLCIWDPAGREILTADPRENLDRLSVADLFFESREPLNEDYPISDLQADFPEGEYTVGGIDFEGTARTGTATFTHDIPSGPTITSPELADGPDTASSAVVDPAELVVAWQEVTDTIDGGPVEITGYQVIVTHDDWVDPNGLSRPVYDVHVPPDQFSLAVPSEFLRPATVYEVEVLALELSGNQTISIGFVTTS